MHANTAVSNIVNNCSNTVVEPLKTVIGLLATLVERLHVRILDWVHLCKEIFQNSPYVMLMKSMDSFLRPRPRTSWLTAWLRFKMGTTTPQQQLSHGAPHGRREGRHLGDTVRCVKSYKMDSSNAKEIKTMKLCKLNTSCILDQSYGS